MNNFYKGRRELAFWKELSKPRYNNSFFAPLSLAQGEISNFPFSLKPEGAHTFSLMKKYAKNQGVECSPRSGTILLESKNSPPTGGSNSLDSLTSIRPESLTATHPKADGRACANKDSLCIGIVSIHNGNARPIEQGVFGSFLTDRRLFFGHVLGFLRDMFDKCSTAVRQSFDWASTRSRRTVEAHPKKTRSCPEAVSNKSRSCPEAVSNKSRRAVEQLSRNSRRNGLFFTQILRGLQVHFMCGGGTVVLLQSYWSPTKVVGRRYWRGTKEVLNAYGLVPPQYNRNRRAVQPEADCNGSRIRSLKPIAYGLKSSKPATNGHSALVMPGRRFFEKIKCLQPIAYGLSLIFVSMFSLSDAWAQSRDSLGAAEGQESLEVFTLTAIVESAATGMPLEGVRIQVDGLDRSYFTGRDGRFNIQTGKISGILTISLAGFETLTCNFEQGLVDGGRDNVWLKAAVSDITPLHIGDAIPDKLWDLPLAVVNHDQGREVVSLREYQDRKLIVLDFWAVFCKPCIKTITAWEETMTMLSERDIAYLTVYVDMAHRALPFIKGKNWKSTAIVGESHALLNAYFFDRHQLGGVVFIYDDKFYAIPADKGYELERLRALLAGEQVEIKSDMSFAHKHNAKGEPQ